MKPETKAFSLKYALFPLSYVFISLLQVEFSSFLKNIKESVLILQPKASSEASIQELKQSF